MDRTRGFGASPPLRVAVANDYPLVVAGTARALEPYAAEVVVVEYDSGTFVLSDVDVVLFDCFAQVPGTADLRAELLGQSVARLVVYSWNTPPAMVQDSLAAGAAGVVSKTASAAELVDALLRVHRGERVTPPAAGEVDGAAGGADDDGGEGVSAGGHERWPGAEAGLSARESEVLALICRGLSNQEIAEAAYLGLNTVKTYIRTGYRKIGVESRTQAVVWGMSHGFEPRTLRVFPT